MGEAVRHMDQATQQNAALVEEMAAAASSLKSQAQELVQVVAVFKLNDNDSHVSQPRPSAVVRTYQPGPSSVTGPKRSDAGSPKRIAARAPTPAFKPAKAASTPAKLALAQPAPPKASAKPAAPAGGDDDWETF
jgi:hypothetical protein